MLLAVLNTPPDKGSAALTANVLRETLGRGGRAMLPRIAEPSLAAAFVDPATRWLAAHGAPVALGRRLRAVEADGDRVKALVWSDGRQEVAGDEAVILAVPPGSPARCFPKSLRPTGIPRDRQRPFRDARARRRARHAGPDRRQRRMGLCLPDRISVTVSAADAIVDEDREALAALLADICAAYRIDAPMPAWQIVKEKRATFAAAPDQEPKRPVARTRWRNLFLAGDWTDTGRPPRSKAPSDRARRLRGW